MEILIKAGQLLLSLSILVVLHEMGHFLPAKWFKTRVEKFYLFFDPWFSLAKFTKGGTEYGIGWLPLGGYVKISGMIDESMDKEQMKLPPKEWEFRSKPAWQRLIIMLGGVIVNLILGFVIYSGVLFAYGESYISPENAKFGMATDSLAQSIGFQDGDLVTAFVSEDGKEALQKVGGINIELLLSDIQELEIIRDGKTMMVPVPEDFGQRMIDTGSRRPFTIDTPFVIKTIDESGGAANAGLLVGDSIVRANDIRTPFFGALSKEITSHKNSSVELDWFRDGKLMTGKVNTNADGQIQVAIESPLAYFDVTQKDYGFLEAIPAGFNKAGDILNKYVVSMKFLFSPKGAQQAGGFIAIGNMFSPEWDWQSFWINTAFLSLILAFMNILPIPALDGGHVMFLLYEIIAGRKPGEKFMERAQMFGIILLLTLMILVNGNDIYKAIFGGF